MYSWDFKIKVIVFLNQGILFEVHKNKTLPHPIVQQSLKLAVPKERSLKKTTTVPISSDCTDTTGSICMERFFEAVIELISFI